MIEQHKMSYEGPSITKKLVDVREMAKVLNVPISWIYQRTMQGQEAIPHIKLGKYVRFNPDEVICFFQGKEPHK
jgi:predicted DNA-binding transcriptional regulator AlpA